MISNWKTPPSYGVPGGPWSVPIQTHIVMSTNAMHAGITCLLPCSKLSSDGSRATAMTPETSGSRWHSSNSLRTRPPNIAASKSSRRRRSMQASASWSPVHRCGVSLLPKQSLSRLMRATAPVAILVAFVLLFPPVDYFFFNVATLASHIHGVHMQICESHIQILHSLLSRIDGLLAMRIRR